MNAASGLLLLLLRGCLLWLVVPLALAAWVLMVPWMLRRDVLPRAVIGWAHLNLIAGLQRTVCRWGTDVPLEWTRWAELPNVTHRVRFIDPI